MQTSQDYIQALIHNGRLFEFRRFYPNAGKLTDLASAEILVITGDLEFHATLTVKAVGTMELYGFADTVVSANGTPLVARNRHYNGVAAHAYTPGVTAFHTPTITNDGTGMFDDMVAAGGTQGASSSGAATDFAEGFVLKPNTQYLLRITNVSGAPAVMHATITGHEQPAEN